ncbi:MAG TPA: hypothetical protein VIS72_14340 [Anaerolineales bacterium]
MDQTPIFNPFDEDEKSGSRPILWAMLGMAALCCGVIFAAAFVYFQPDAKSLFAQYFPSPTPTPSRTPTSTPTNTSTPTKTPTPTPNLTATVQVRNAMSAVENALSNWKVVLTDTFDSDTNLWLVEESDDEYALINYEIVDGKYRWDVTAHRSFIGWVRSDRQSLTDFYLSVNIQQLEGPDSADFGVIFREDDDSNFYYFGITNQGEYALYLFLEEWDTLISWTRSDLIKPGETNRITVIGDGARFIFFINDQYLTEITDDSIPEGSSALAVEMEDENDHAVFEFDNFELREP